MTFARRLGVQSSNITASVKEVSSECQSSCKGLPRNMSKEASKAVVKRRQGGAMVSVSDQLTSKRPPKTALDEDEFTDVSYRQLV